MLKRMILINSANFQFADIDLSKETFFVGDNTGGKSTTTRALHFLYNGDGKNLGIPSTKDTFSKHYFPNDDSYIIYVFNDFFIFTYKKNDTISRWFSKQEFNLERVIKNGALKGYKSIESYIKEASLSHKPKSIEEYTSILYGHKMKDFAIADIEHHDVFIDLFNMIFNIDKAIVTSSDIKKAIQKSLKREDKSISIDYDDFTRKLNGFLSSYNFFKTFESCRTPLKEALFQKDELLKLEAQLDTKIKAMSYRHQYEVEILNEQYEKVLTIDKSIQHSKRRAKSIDRFYTLFEKRLDTKITPSEKNITRLHLLRETFDALGVEDNTLLANKFDLYSEELRAKTISLSKLEEKRSSAEEEVRAQIKALAYVINVSLRNEANQNIAKLKEEEDSGHDNNKLEIEKEYEPLEDEAKTKIRVDEEKIKVQNKKQETTDLKLVEEKGELEETYACEAKAIKTKREGNAEKQENLEVKLRTTQTEQVTYQGKLVEHAKKYKELRHNNAVELNTKRKAFNTKIINARNIINPKENTLNEFLSNEVEGWESSIYPLIDKNLLGVSSDILKPEIAGQDAGMGFKVDISILETIPTKDEAYEIIYKAKAEKKETLSISKEVYNSEVSKLDETKYELEFELETLSSKIENLIKAIATCNVEELRLKKQKKDNLKEETNALIALHEKYAEIREQIEKRIEALKDNLLAYNTEIKELEKAKTAKIRKSKENRDSNIKNIIATQKKELERRRKEKQDEINGLKKNIESMDENSLIEQLGAEVKALEVNKTNAQRAKDYLDEYKKSKDEITQLPVKEMELNKLKKLKSDRKSLVSKANCLSSELQDDLRTKKETEEKVLNKYKTGIEKFKTLDIELGKSTLESNQFLSDIIIAFEDGTREHENIKTKLQKNINKLKKLELHSLIELNFNMEAFIEAKRISDLTAIIESLEELDNFEKNKFDGEKKRQHNSFNSFLRLKIPNNLKTFEDLENDFEKARASINKSLALADFGVIRDIKLITDPSKKKHDSLSSLLSDLSKKVNDTIGLYASESLFYHDVSKSVENIDEIQRILADIKKKGSNAPINLFDTIELSIAYIENGTKQEKPNIKDDSSGGGNILLKVAIAMSILERFAKTTTDDTPFFLIIDEISKLQNKNQELIRKYINQNGFKTLFITPDPAYPDPERALYYTFKNIQDEGETLEISQMNII